ncbi:unnamed protein product [Acanthoscelides obtectus]|uniref:Facilitated trehalose transporter Tret1-like n=1 Tax=Acanthoscelides obtectus TaxID=200917 RepID=A0A9P0K589_ACAOB|nr:unnamed protein product [Acanthoscelides obtectus]CAK1633218.1 Facilitated trehalose transporter Tret1 [Acanthoscelides obtectus]
MEEDKKIVASETVTYVFGSANDQDMIKDTAPTRGLLWQVVPCTCASLICIPFGLMLGWPSPTYPYLLNNVTSPILISMDQSAMIAGFLMLGNTIGTPLSATESLGPKYGVLVGLAAMTSGWFVMWQANNIYYLLGSRLLVGLGHGFGIGQVKLYIAGICNQELQPIFLKLINFYALGGVIAIYCFGPFLAFRETSMVCLITSVALVFFMAFLPATPKELIKAKKISDARRLISYIKPHLNVTNEINMLKENLNSTVERYGMIKLLRNKKLHSHFFIFVIISILQQFTGAPSTVVYTQIIFERSHVPNAMYVSIGYICILFVASIIGIFIIPKFNKKVVLLLSSTGISIILAIKICVIYFQINNLYWPYASVAVMYVFIFIHTLGLGNVPFMLIQYLFPEKYHLSLTHLFIMINSMCALIITKIFQVLISLYSFHVGFCMFLGFSLFCLVFVFLFLPSKTEDMK